MAISFRCLFCDKRYQVRDSQAGREIRCTSCGASLTIPGDDHQNDRNQSRENKSRDLNSPSRDRPSPGSPAEDRQWLGRPAPSSHPSESPATLSGRDSSRNVPGNSPRRPSPETESQSGFARVIAVVVLLVSIMLPLSKLLFRQMQRGQRRPAAAQNPFFDGNRRVRWESFSPEEGDFTIDVPEDMQVAGQVPPYATRQYRWNNALMEGDVTVVELTPSIALDIPDSTVYALFQKAIVNREQPRVRPGRSRITQKTTPEFHEFEFEMVVNKLRCRLLISGTKLYILKLTYRDPIASVAPETFDRYFDSFKVQIAGDIPAEERPAKSYQERLKSFEKKISKEMPSPQDWTIQIAPPGVKAIRYQSGEYELPAWLAVPAGGEHRKQPAFVYLHGGNAFDKLDFEFCKPALDAGFVVLVPIFRSENGHPGNFEAMLGEADDAAAAVKWLSRHEAVDPERIYVFGHDFGGGIAGLLSLRDDVPIRHTGSCGGLYHDFSFYVWALGDTLPFPLMDKNEREMRLLIANLGDMQRPHLAYVGNNDFNQLFLPTIKRKLAELQPAQPPLHIEGVPGDHISSLDESIRRYVQFMKSENAGKPPPQDQANPLIDPKKKTINL
ncbi:MAG: hypothetical protein WD065_15520 [Planctomycetaceae bacterium]